MQEGIGESVGDSDSGGSGGDYESSQGFQQEDDSVTSVDRLADYMGTLVPGMEPPRHENSPAQQEAPADDSISVPPAPVQTTDGNPPLPPKTRPHRNGDAISVSNGQQGSNEDVSSDAAPGDLPVVPPRPRKEQKKQSASPASTPNAPNQRPYFNGLPPTPKVHMGACFSKVFNGCPLHINCTASWINPETKDQHMLLAADEGVYTLNLNQIADGSLELVSAQL